MTACARESEQLVSQLADVVRDACRDLTTVTGTAPVGVLVEVCRDRFRPLIAAALAVAREDERRQADHRADFYPGDL